MVLAEKQTYQPMEQNIQPRKKKKKDHIHLWSINLQQRRQEYAIEKRQSLQEVVLGELNSYI